jgi:hypothetical protein
MNAGLKRRLRKLEKQYGASGHTEEKVQKRAKRAVLTTLSDAELQSMEEYLQLRNYDSHAEPNAEQKAALDLYEKRYLELQATGKLMVNESGR